MQERVGVIGLGYVGLPVALAFADAFEGTVGFDVKQGRVDALRAGFDVTAEVEKERLVASSLRVTADPADLAGVTFFVVTVPTPIDDSKRPDLTAMIKASETVGRVLQAGRRGRLRVDRLPRCDRGDLRSSARANLGPALWR